MIFQQSPLELYDVITVVSTTICSLWSQKLLKLAIKFIESRKNMYINILCGAFCGFSQILQLLGAKKLGF
jgi:hypothetical protein